MEFPIIKACRPDLKKIDQELSLPNFLPWKLIKPYDKQVQKNRGRSLKKIAESGGLYAPEIVAAIHGQTFLEYWKDFQIGQGISAEDYRAAVEKIIGIINE